MERSRTVFFGCGQRFTRPAASEDSAFAVIACRGLPGVEVRRHAPVGGHEVTPCSAHCC